MDHNTATTGPNDSMTYEKDGPDRLENSRMYATDIRRACELTISQIHTVRTFRAFAVLTPMAGLEPLPTKKLFLEDSQMLDLEEFYFYSEPTNNLVLHLEAFAVKIKKITFGVEAKHNEMEISSRLPFLLVGIVLVAAGYSLYQIPQRISLRPSISLLLPIDNWIPFRPMWTWIYIFAYYPFLTTLILLIPSWEDFWSIFLSFTLMLITHIFISLIFPVRVPDAWRISDCDAGLSSKLLRFVQTIDKGGNCFPSMHVAIAVVSAYHLQRLINGPASIDVLIWSFPVLIGASTVFTKQHYFVDVPAGASLGLVGWMLYTTFFCETF